MIRAEVYSSSHFLRIEVGLVREAVPGAGYFEPGQVVEILASRSPIRDLEVSVAIASGHHDPADATFRAALYALAAEIGTVLDRLLRTEGFTFAAALAEIEPAFRGRHLGVAEWRYL